LKKKLASLAPAFFVLLSFVISRLFYIREGLRFDNTPPRYYYQFIDPVLLKTRLLESIWYLHSQPPLFNVVTGALYQQFSPRSAIFQLLFFVLGLVFSLILYWLGLRLGLHRWVSALLAAWFIVSPATVLYENLYFYTYPVAFILVLSALALSKFLESETVWWGFGFFSLIASLCLTWAVFHWAWMLTVIALVALFYRNWHKLAAVSLIPFLLVIAWYAKNLLLFGSFAASSWVGMNLSHVTFLSPLTSQLVRDELVEQGQISAYPVTEAFRPIENYDGLIAIPSPRGVPVLDEPLKSTEAVNFNHSFYMGLSEEMLGDAINFMRVRPDLYLASVKQGFLIYFHSSSDYLLLKDKPAPQLESWWDRIFYGQFSGYEGDYNNRWKADGRYVGWWLMIAYVAATIHGIKVAMIRNTTNPSLRAVVAFMTFTILYFTLMTNFLDLGENNRFRFTLDALVLLLFGMLLQNLIRKGQVRIRR
jgi:hypothetical protein